MVSQILCSIDPRPIVVADLEAHLEDAASGAVSTFVGRVRNHHAGHAVQSLYYESYRPMAEKVLHGILRQACESFEVRKVVAHHRIGHLGVGDIAVYIGVAAVHRDAAFSGCRFIIEAIKTSLPVWKREECSDGRRRWQPGAQPTPWRDTVLGLKDGVNTSRADAAPACEADARRVAVVLAGGRSSRFGYDKSRALWQGRAMADRVATTLEGAGAEVWLSGPVDSLAGFRWPVIEDWQPFAGPLAALFGAMRFFVDRELPYSHLMVAACDMPNLNDALLQAMWRLAPGKHLVLPRSGAYLPGLYSFACLPWMEALIAGGRRDLRALLELDIDVAYLPETHWAQLGLAEVLLHNVNTQADLSGRGVDPSSAPRHAVN